MAMNIETKYLRPAKAAMLRERYAMYDAFAEARIAEIEDGLVLPACADCRGDVITGVVDCDGCFLADSHMVDYPAEVEQWAKGLDCSRSDETVAYVGLFNPHWGHFITDCLSTFWFLGSVEVDKYVFSCHQGERPDVGTNIRMALELLGVWDKVEFVAEARRYRKIYVPRKGMVPRDYVLRESARVYDAIISRGLTEYGDRQPEHGGRVLLSRAHFPKAALNDLGTTEVEDVFCRNGFTAVYPEEMTLTELIGCLAGARQVAAISGTLTHNMLFAPQGAELIVIEKYASINNYQQGIDRLRDLHVTYIDAGYQIWSVDPGLGPFIMGYTPELRCYATDNGMVCALPAPSPRKTLRRYFRLFYRHYKRSWVLPEWLEVELPLLREAYRASEPVFGPWLDGRHPLFMSDFLHPRYLAKTLRKYLRRILR